MLNSTSIIDRLQSASVETPCLIKGLEPLCWSWTKPLDHGYSRLGIGHTAKDYGHRLAYMIFIGEIPEGLELDHLCRNRRCWNPWHLDPVTHKINMSRSRARSWNRSKTHCAAGHRYDSENTYERPRGGRDCIKCQRARGLDWWREHYAKPVL